MSTTPLDDATPSDRPAAPYPGLRPFEKQEWSIFFGRETMVQDVVTGLLDRHLVAVHGESGCGKSSLVRAGVLPFLESDQTRAGGSWRTVEFRPGDSPLANLSAALQPLSGEDDDPLTIRRLIMRGESAPAKIAAHLGLTVADNLCILFDQFEELFEHARRRGPTEAEILTGFLVSLALNPPAGLHVIVTMRSDYLGQCAHWRGFAETVNATQYLVPRMERPALWRAIREPATLFGGTLSPELTERVIAEAGYGQDQLPLIQHGLMRLWQRKTGGDPDAEGWRLDLPDYRALDGGGGLAGILSDHADACLQDKDEQVAEAIFRALADRNADGEAIRRPQTLQQLADVAGTTPASVADVLAPFRAAGAAFIRPGGDTPLTPETRIDIGHESFLRSWRRIADPETGWLKKETDDGLRWMSLRLQARDFATSRRLLADGAEHDAAKLMGRTTEAWSGRHGGDWGEVKELVETSREAAAKRKRNIKGKIYWSSTIAGLFAAVSVAMFILAIAMQDTATQAEFDKKMALALQIDAEVAKTQAIKSEKRANEALLQATFNESLSLAVLSQIAAIEGQYADAIKLALAAWPRTGDAERPALKKVFEAFSKAFMNMRERFRFIHAAPVSSAVFSPDGTLVLTASEDNLARIWDATMGKTLGVPMVHNDFVSSGSFSPDSSTVLTSSWDGAVRLWESETGQLVKTIVKHGNSVVLAKFSPSGKQIVSASTDGMVYVFSTEKINFPGFFINESSAVLDVSFSPDEEKLVVACYDGTVRIYDIQTGFETGLVMRHNDSVRKVSFSPDGTKIFTGSRDGSVRMWDSRSGQAVGAPIEHPGPVINAIISQDNLKMLTISTDNIVRIWNAKTGEPNGNDLIHRNLVRNAMFISGSDLIVSHTADNIYLWDTKNGSIIYIIGTHNLSINSVNVSPDEEKVVSGSSDRTVRIFVLDKNKIPQKSDFNFDFYFRSDSLDLNKKNEKPSDTLADLRLEYSISESGNPFEVACQRLGNNTDLSDVIAKYGLGKLTPICGENMPILPDMSTLQ